MSRENPIAYEVVGLPPGQDVRIAFFQTHGWRFRLELAGRSQGWQGSYADLHELTSRLGLTPKRRRIGF